MPTTRASGLIVVVFLLSLSQSGASQTAPLTIVSAGPLGELGTLADADEIRITFSAPMVALGTAPAGAAPPWIHVTPEAAGDWCWSGTRTLLFSPSVSNPLPFATTFSVRVDASAASVDGRVLGAPFELTF